MQQALLDLLAYAGTLGDAPTIVGKAEVDQINIISRWIYRHSDDRAFFPFHQALTGEQEAQALCQQIWEQIDHVRTLPLPLGEDEDELMEI